MKDFYKDRIVVTLSFVLTKDQIQVLENFANNRPKLFCSEYEKLVIIGLIDAKEQILTPVGRRVLEWYKKEYLLEGPI